LQELLAYLKTFNSFLIWGFGIEGRSTYRFLRKHLGDVKIAIADARIDKTFPDDALHIEKSVPFDELKAYDITIKSPGISLYRCSIEPGVYPITSQTELALRFFSKQIIGITGTKGKSTTATLTYNLLKAEGFDTKLVGNIGQSVFDVLDEITQQSYLVYELSAHQLDNVHFSPHIAVLLNLYQEHLDYYKDVESYFGAKKNIFRYQNSGDFLILSDKYEFASSAKTVTVSEEKQKKEFEAPLNVHPLTVNVLIEIAKTLEIKKSLLKDVLKEFKGLEHRLELVAQIEGKSYYNDSIATAVEATLFALHQLPNIDTLIMGGDNRGIDYQPLADYLKKSNIQRVVTMFESGKILQKLLQGSNIELFHTNSFDEALRHSKNSVLFSPASASYGSFKNFAKRGQKFKEAVLHKTN